MQFLKILFWCLLAFVAALFTYGNWTSVPLQLWSGMEALVKLPFLLLIAFLLGFLPTYVYNRAVRWRLRQRLNATERSLAEARAVVAPTPPAYIPAPVVEPAPPVDPLTPLAEGRLV
ncbi:hypothetical protein ACT009_01605 [Sphingomonas sp. Tas61C01]|uniref:hypothetical protein n=1 Tax=Sphingomonas sp. Tas61C01 TaxID=3458297 RepID=UPI00403EC4AF